MRLYLSAVLQVVVLLFSVYSTAEENPKSVESIESASADNYLIDDPHFGMRLGEDTATLEAKCKAEKIRIKKNQYYYTDRDFPAEIWSFDGSLSKNEAIKETKVEIYKGHIFEVEFIFKDATLENFRIIKGGLQLKYEETSQPKLITIGQKATFSHTVNDKEEIIVLSRDEGYMQADTLSLRYVHDELKEKVLHELRVIKAKKISNEL